MAVLFPRLFCALNVDNVLRKRITSLLHTDETKSFAFKGKFPVTKRNIVKNKILEQVKYFKSLGYVS